MHHVKKLLQELIQFQSYRPEEINRCIDYINTYLTAANIATEVIENGGLKSLVARVGPLTGPTLVYNAHVDVVQSDPSFFSMKEEDGRWIGPGIFDMKASVAVLMKLLVDLREKKLPYPIMAQFVPDEEVGGQLGTAYLVEKGYVGDFVICLEPTQLNISVQSKGVLWIEANFSGKANHASRPWLADNAVEKAFACYEALRQLPVFSRSGRLFKQGSVALTLISGGDSRNTIPDHCRVTFDMRYLPEQSREEITAAVSPLFERYDARWHELTHGFPVVTSPDNGSVTHLHRVTKAKWRDSAIIGQDGSSDARFFTPLGVAGIEFGPVGGNQHRPDEYIDVNALELFDKILMESSTQLF